MEKGMKTVEKRCTQGGGMMGPEGVGRLKEGVYMTQVERNGESARHRVTFTTKPKKWRKPAKTSLFSLSLCFLYQEKTFLNVQAFRNRSLPTKEIFFSKTQFIS